MAMTFFNRRPEVRDVIVDYFIKNNLQSICSTACSYGAEIYDFIFKLVEKGAYKPELKILGCDIRLDIIQSLNMRRYEYRNIDIASRNWSASSVGYPYPIMPQNMEYLYKPYFNENKTLKDEFVKIPKFFVHDINNEFTEKYDIVMAFAVLTHLCNNSKRPFYGKKDRQHIFNILKNLINATNKILIISCPKTFKIDGVAFPSMIKKFVDEFLFENNLQYSIMNDKFYFIYPNGI